MILFLLILRVLGHVVYPRSHVLPHTLLESEPESAVTPVSAFACQLLGGERSVGCNSFAIEICEMVDAKIVDIGIVSDALGREMLTEIETVGPDSFGKLGDVQVVLQVKLCIYAMALQQ